MTVMLKLPLTRDQLYTCNNVLRILCHIKELCKPTDTPIFTLRDEKKGLESLRTLFVSLTINDPTEATFAETVFNDVGYWLKAREIVRLKSHLDEWREEADIKRKAMAFESIINEVRTQGKSAFSAAKYLIDEPYKPSKTKEAKAQVRKTTEKAKSVYKDDLSNLEEFMDKRVN